jgi:ABC-type uncharacterized transport system permease subunit
VPKHVADGFAQAGVRSHDVFIDLPIVPALQLLHDLTAVYPMIRQAVIGGNLLLFANGVMVVYFSQLLDEICAVVGEAIDDRKDLGSALIEPRPVKYFFVLIMILLPYFLKIFLAKLKYSTNIFFPSEKLSHIRK